MPTIDFVIRDFAEHADYAACVELQRDTWGRTFNDVVPPSILKVTQLLGGVAAGAFASDGTLLGFVYGLTGLRRGELVHWSDMLAVRADAQAHGIGRALKEHQRAAVRARGVATIHWTYDPLVARNAHLNLMVLGAAVDEYVEDMYGDTGSDLHRGLGTDRFVLAWPTDPAAAAARARRARAVGESFASAPLANAPPGGAPAGDWRGSPRIRIAIPGDVTRVQRETPELGPAWRASTRAAFQAAFAARYSVVGASVARDEPLAFYLLERERERSD